MLCFNLTLTLPSPCLLTLPWPLLDLALTMPWPCLGPPLTYWPWHDLVFTMPWCYFDSALTLPWSFFDLALTLPWPCIDDLSLALPRHFLILPWPYLDLTLTFPDFFGSRNWQKRAVSGWLSRNTHYGSASGSRNWHYGRGNYIVWWGGGGVCKVIFANNPTRVMLTLSWI